MSGVDSKKIEFYNKIFKNYLMSFLFLILLGICFIAIPVDVSAKGVVRKRIEMIRKEYPNKSKMNEWVGVDGFNGGGCNALEMYVTLRVFHNCYTPDCDTYKAVGKSASTSDTAAMKKLFGKAKIGDVVRFRKGSKDAHYAIFLSSNSGGAYLYESNFGGENVVRYNNYWSWSVMKSWPAGGATKVDIYRSKNYDKVNKGKAAKLYKKGDIINYDVYEYQVTKVSGFGGEVKLLGFEEGSADSIVNIPAYIYVDNISEEGLNCNYRNGSGDTKSGSVSNQMIYKVTAIGDNAMDVLVDDEDGYDDDEDDDYYETDYYPSNNQTVMPAVPVSPVKLGANGEVESYYVYKVTIGKKVEKIGSNAFRGVKKIDIKSKNLKKISSTAFINTDDKLVIKVPSSKYNKYKKLLSNKGQSGNVVIKK